MTVVGELIHFLSMEQIYVIYESRYSAHDTHRSIADHERMEEMNLISSDI